MGGGGKDPLLLLLLLSRFCRVRLCGPIDGSPPGSPVPGILQALGVPLGGTWRVGGLLRVAGRLSGTVSPFRAEQGTSLETPSRARVLSLAQTHRGRPQTTSTRLYAGGELQGSPVWLRPQGPCRDGSGELGLILSEEGNSTFLSSCSGGLRPLVELCVEPAGLCGRCSMECHFSIQMFSI